MFPAGFDEHRHIVSTPRAEVSYIDVGTGPSALFVHGLATSACLWQELIRHLGAGRRCIAVDLPLHGHSPVRPGQKLTIGAFADVLADLIAQLGLWEIDLVGHDTGGAIAQVLAARHPERLRTLTLTNCETQDNVPPAAMASTVELARAGQLAAAAPAIIGDPAAARAFFEPGYQNPDFLTADMIGAFLNPVLGTPESAERFQELIAGLGPAELLASEPALRRLDVPTLIAWGTDDHFFDLKWAYWLQGEIPTAYQVIEMTGAKLFFPHENAAELAPHIRKHWNTAARAYVSDPEAARTDLTDALCDAIDEYRTGEASLAGAAGLSALMHDVDTTIRELARLDDPARAGQMRDQWKIATSVLEEAETSTTPALSPSQHDRITDAVQVLRNLAEAPSPTRVNNPALAVGQIRAAGRSPESPAGTAASTSRPGGRGSPGIVPRPPRSSQPHHPQGPAGHPPALVPRQGPLARRPLAALLTEALGR
jgi:pimeloyl-ACP methyl ester carboxylesterase